MGIRRQNQPLVALPAEMNYTLLLLEFQKAAGEKGSHLFIIFIGRPLFWGTIT
jgi:hypothetical protein